MTEFAINTDPARALAVVTGASSGIGAIFAAKLAARGMDLLLIARREERLAALKELLEKDLGVRVHVLTADLSDAAALNNLADALGALPRIDVLVNAAGFGLCADFAGLDARQVSDQLTVDLVAPARLCRTVLPSMVARRQGAIVNVASMAGFLPIPRFAIYSSAKAGLIRLTEALHGEVAQSGVVLQALCPGPVPTEFFGVSGYKLEDVPHFLRQSAEDCVDSSLRALERRILVHIPQPAIWLFVFILGLFPVKVRVQILGGGAKWWTRERLPGKA